ncbi:MAG: hypothetical protein H6509_12095 [Bryobacterales bacterium]|nr:hypothetical protein [Acidobacteriota bacterium]MCB9385346.1 hypothetical protein [Bryobacterales bacterium]
MEARERFEGLAFDPEDPDPWLALYLDTSLPLTDEVKGALLDSASSRSRQFLLPLIRPFAKLSIALLQVVKVFVPNRFTSSRVLHRTIYWGLKHFVRPEANYLILRHFHIGSELLAFVASNVPGVQIPLKPLRPRCLKDLVDNVFLQHDLNIFNFLIRLNREMKEKGVEIQARRDLNFDAITDGPFDIDVAGLPTGKLNAIDVETAIEVYTPLYQLFLTDSDFWRANNSLQLDETIAIYCSRLIGDLSYVGLVNNKHPLVPLSTLQAGYRLMLHGLAAESLHANLVALKRARA